MKDAQRASGAARAVRWRSLALLLGWLALLALPAGRPAAGTTRPHCQVCGRYTDTSPCHVQASFTIKKHNIAVDVCSLFCYAERREDFSGEPESLLIQAYPQDEDEAAPWLNARRAFYLFDASGDVQDCSEPFTYGFRTKDEARAAAKLLGGELLEWDSAWERCAELAADYEPRAPRYY